MRDVSAPGFVLVTETLELETRGDDHVIDLTGELQRLVGTHRLVEGNVLVFVPGSTAGITTVEHEPGLLRDLPELFERLAPRRAHYHHEETWHDGNAVSP